MKESDEMVRNEFSKMFKNYNRRIRPSYSGDKTVVNVDMSILKFGNINEVQMTYPVDLFLRQQWHDKRLRHNLSEPIIPMPGQKTPTDFIWTPDTHFINAQKASRHRVTVSNDKWDIYSDGTVFWGTRVSLVASCKMDFRKYPMDTQVCGLSLESYAYPREHLVYQWYNRGAEVISKEMAQFTLTNTKNESDETYYESSGTYSILEATFTFKRQLAGPIMQIFFPCIAIVCVSWITLWIHKNCISSRFGVGMTTLLTICTIWGAVNRGLPKVHYVKAVDIYFIVSFCFILFVIIEFALVLNFNTDELKKKEVDSKQQNSIQRKNVQVQPIMDSMLTGVTNFARKRLKIPPINTAHEVSELIVLTELDNRGRYVKYSYAKKSEATNLKRKVKRNKLPTWFSIYPVYDKSSKLDICSRILFPVMYFCFNLAFFLTYLKSEDEDMETLY